MKKNSHTLFSHTVLFWSCDLPFDRSDVIRYNVHFLYIYIYEWILCICMQSTHQTSLPQGLYISIRSRARVRILSFQRNMNTSCKYLRIFHFSFLFSSSLWLLLLLINVNKCAWICALLCGHQTNTQILNKQQQQRKIPRGLQVFPRK